MRGRRGKRQIKGKKKEVRRGGTRVLWAEEPTSLVEGGSLGVAETANLYLC